MKLIKGLILAAVLPLVFASCGGGGGSVDGDKLVGKWKVEEFQMGDQTMTADMLGEMTIEFNGTEMTNSMTGEAEPYTLDGGYIVGESDDDKMKVEKCTDTELVLSGEQGDQKMKMTLSKM